MHIKTCRENMKNMHFIAPECGSECSFIHTTTNNIVYVRWGGGGAEARLLHLIVLLILTDSPRLRPTIEIIVEFTVNRRRVIIFTDYSSIYNS